MGLTLGERIAEATRCAFSSRAFAHLVGRLD
jgi:hypothetical protein